MWKCFLALNVACVVMGAEPFRKVLTSASGGIHVEAWELSPKDAGKTGFKVRKETLHGGKQEGVDIITIENGRLSVVVIPTRGMGLANARMGEIRLGWDSPVKEIVHPQYINLQSRGGLGWLEGFNEFMVRCGLEFAGHPGKDKFINNTGDEAEMDLTLHGKIQNIPASEVEVIVEPEPHARLRVRGRVDERMFYGPKLELWTEISMEPNSNRFRVEDQIKNQGAFDQEFQMIYHCNYGAPLLEEGARFVGASAQITPFNANAAKGMKTYDTYAGPTPGFIEQVYCIRPLADGDGRSTIMLHNAASNRGVAMTFNTKELPYLTLWKNTPAKEEGYVTGLEPGTGFPFNRRVERHFGRVPKLKSGETRAMGVEFAILKGGDAIEATRAKIKALQTAPPKMDADPVPLPN